MPAGEVLASVWPKVDAALLAPPRVVTVDGGVVHLVAAKILLLWRESPYRRCGDLLLCWLLTCQGFCQSHLCFLRPSLLIFILGHGERAVVLVTADTCHPTEYLNNLHYWNVAAWNVLAKLSILLDSARHAMPHCQHTNTPTG